MLPFLLIVLYITLAFYPMYAAIRLKRVDLIGITAMTGCFAFMIVPWVVGMALVGSKMPKDTKPCIPFWGFAAYWAVMLLCFLTLPFVSYFLGTLNGYQFLSLSSLGGDLQTLPLSFVIVLSIAIVLSLFLRGRALWLSEHMLSFFAALPLFMLTVLFTDDFSRYMVGSGQYVLVFLLLGGIGAMMYMDYLATARTAANAPQAAAQLGSSILRSVNKDAVADKLAQFSDNIRSGNLLNTASPLTVRCVSGEHAGAEFQLKPGEILTLGSSPQLANLLFTASDISRLHCMLICPEKSNKVRIVDYSTNGTYLHDGTRLPPKEPKEFSRPCRFLFCNRPEMFELT